MKLLFISDIQAHNYTQYSTRLSNGKNSRLQNVLDAISHAREICIQNKIDVLFFLGDLFESRTKLDIDVLTSTYTEFMKLCASVPAAYAIVGNHDQYTKTGEVHSIEIFREAGVRVVDLPTLERLYDIDVAMHPYTTDIDSLKKFMAIMPPADLFLFHQGLSEATTGPFDMHTKAELSVKDLPIDKVRLCLAGHYHKRQSLLNGKVHYVGSPLQLTFGERDEPKGFLEINTEDWELTWHKSRAPVFRYFTSIAQFNEWVGPLGGDPNKDFVRVNCSTEDARDIQRKYPRIQTEVTEVEEVQETRITLDQANDDAELLKLYIQKESVQDLDPDALLEVGMGMINAD